MKKIVISLTLVMIAFGSFSWGASAASWTLVDKKTVSGATSYLDGVKGGNAKICLKDQFGGLRFDIYDNDGSNSPLIKSGVFINNNSCYTFDASKYVDGTDKNAEFKLVTTRTPIGKYTLELWD